MNISIIVFLGAIDGTIVDGLEHDYFCEAVEDIRALVIKKLKDYE